MVNVDDGYEPRVLYEGMGEKIRYARRDFVLNDVDRGQRHIYYTFLVLHFHLHFIRDVSIADLRVRQRSQKFMS